MKHILKMAAATAMFFTSVPVAGAGVTMQIVSDNDFAVFVGSSTSVDRLVYQNDVGWSAQENALSSFTFDFEAGETTIYLLAMGAGGPENIGGRINGVDITTITVDVSSNLANQLTGYHDDYAAIDNGVFSAALADVQAALPGLTWGTPGSSGEGVGAGVTGAAFSHDEFSTVIYRFSTRDVGVETVPEPASALLGLAAIFIVIRRHRQGL